MERIMKFGDFVNEKEDELIVKKDKATKGLLFKMIKVRSPLTVEFIEDPEDKDMIKIRYVNKDGVEKRHHTINRKSTTGSSDMLSWKKSLEKEGYAGPSDEEVTKLMNKK